MRRLLNKDSTSSTLRIEKKLVRQGMQFPNRFSNGTVLSTPVHVPRTEQNTLDVAS